MHNNVNVLIPLNCAPKNDTVYVKNVYFTTIKKSEE
jgi:hypothetical protein